MRGGGITVERWSPSYFIREVHLQELNTCVLISLLFRRRGYGGGGGEREGRGGEERMGGVVVVREGRRGGEETEKSERGAWG